MHQYDAQSGWKCHQIKTKNVGPYLQQKGSLCLRYISQAYSSVHWHSSLISDSEASRWPKRNRLLHRDMNCQSTLWNHSLIFIHSPNAKVCGKNVSTICTKTAKTQVCAICFRHLKMTWNDYWMLILHATKTKVNPKFCPFPQLFLVEPVHLWPINHYLVLRLWHSIPTQLQMLLLLKIMTLSST